MGGSTITQQLAKNLLLSGERTLLRKGQENVLTYALENMLTKQRILEIYLNNVEWGEGVFGAEAAAQHYFRKSASRLGPYESARLAVMLPQPKRFEKMPASSYLAAAPPPSWRACATPSCLEAGTRSWAARALGWFLLKLVRLLTGAQARWYGCPPRNSASTSPTTRATPTW